LGEYQAGGIIIVLGQNKDGLPIINNFCGTGMHGGVMYLRCSKLPHQIPKQVTAEVVNGNDIPELVAIVKDYCSHFADYDADYLLNAQFTVLRPNSQNPYKQMYTNN
jgi:glutamate synthase domain-containing protein 3